MQLVGKVVGGEQVAKMECNAAERSHKGLEGFVTKHLVCSRTSGGILMKSKKGTAAGMHGKTNENCALPLQLSPVCDAHRHLSTLE